VLGGNESYQPKIQQTKRKSVSKLVKKMLDRTQHIGPRRPAARRLHNQAHRGAVGLVACRDVTRGACF
jgi:hypothetical protein